jgi:hypothetical protein
MAITAAVRVPPTVDVADCYIRLTDIMAGKNREDDDSDNHTHYITYGVHVSKGGVEIPLRNLDRFKVTDINPAGNLPGLAYADLKARIVGLGWESATSDIEDV